MTNWPSIDGKQVVAIKNMATGAETWFVVPFKSKAEAMDFATLHEVSGSTARLRRTIALVMKGGQS